jgi:hypothetical protein
MSGLRYGPGYSPSLVRKRRLLAFLMKLLLLQIGERCFSRLPDVPNAMISQLDSPHALDDRLFCTGSVIVVGCRKFREEERSQGSLFVIVVSNTIEMYEFIRTRDSSAPVSFIVREVASIARATLAVSLARTIM